MSFVKHTSEFSASNHRAPADPKTLLRGSRRPCRYDSSLRSTGSEGLRGTTVNHPPRSEVGFLVGTIALMLVVAAIAIVFDTPTVFRSQSSGQCVRVEQGTDTHYTCDNLPPRFDLIEVR